MEIVIILNKDISDNSKLGKSQGRKATGLKHSAMIAGLPKRSQGYLTVCQFRHAVFFVHLIKHFILKGSASKNEKGIKIIFCD